MKVWSTRTVTPLGARIGIAVALGLGVTGCAKPCDQCDAGENAYVCDVPSSNNIVCAIDETQANLLCPEGIIQTHVCPGGGGDGAETSGQQEWEPELYISYNTSTEEYEIEQDLIDILVFDGYVLIAQDSARLTQQMSGYFLLSNVQSGDLAALLGLQNNDILLAANGTALDSWQDYTTVAVALVGETQLDLTIYRNAQVSTLTYVLI